MGDWGAGEGLLWSAVAEATAPIAHLEQDWDLNKLEKKLREYFKKAAKNLAFGSKSWEALVGDYAENVFSALFNAMSDREWLCQGQADFLLCVDAGIKDYFPLHLIQHIPQEVFERTVLAAHDRAFEEQRYLPRLWEVTSSQVCDKKLRQKVYGCFEAGRKEAMMHARGLDDFIERWVDSSIRHLSQEARGAPQSLLDEPSSAKLFHALIDKGCLPMVLVEVAGAPPQHWEFVNQAVSRAYATNGSNGGGCQNGNYTDTFNGWGEAAQPAAKRFKGGF